MNYQEAKSYVQEIQQGAGIKPGLDVMKSLLWELGNPQDKLKVIHLAGTNGKGSTGTFLEYVLAQGGRKVGRFASPSVFHERESICWHCGDIMEMISEQEYTQCIRQIQEAISKMIERGQRVPTVFEIETAVAFMMFCQWNCDVVLLEAGMGGKDDSTNVVDSPYCVVITPIDMDHRKFLGDTIQDIAFAKAGVIKEGTKVVTYQENQEALDCLCQVCKERKVPLTVVDESCCTIHQETLEGSVFSYDIFENIQITMLGEYQIKNACLALACIKEMNKHFHFEKNDIIWGMKKAIWQGRFERIHTMPDVVLDGAHNPAGVRAFCQSAKRYYDSYRRIGIMGVFADKEYDAMCKQLKEVLDEVYVVTPPTKRGLSAKVLAETWKQYGVKVKKKESVACCLKSFLEPEMMKKEQEKTVIFVVGSLSILKDAKFYMDFT